MLPGNKGIGGKIENNYVKLLTCSAGHRGGGKAP